MIVEMDNVSCLLNNKYVLRNINWKVNQGEHWAILGLNGSGKTTLLNMINGYVFPSSGNMKVLGNTFGNYDWRLLRKKIGFISSSLQDKFYQHEPALEIVLSGMFASIGLYDKPGKKNIDKALSILHQLKCAHLAQQRYMDLSQGEKQKVLIARALINSPKLLIMDEPCAGLDIFSKEHILASIERITSHGSSPTLLYISHHTEEILPVFSNTLMLRRGKIHSSGKTRQILKQSNLSSFFETPVKVRWHKDRARIDI
jgi:iron complex transport system ATP-binding protein